MVEGVPSRTPADPVGDLRLVSAFYISRSNILGVRVSSDQSNGDPAVFWLKQYDLVSFDIIYD